MGPKRKSSSAALTNSIYQHTEAASSKKRLVNGSQDDLHHYAADTRSLRSSTPFQDTMFTNFYQSEHSHFQTSDYVPEAQARHQPYYTHFQTPYQPYIQSRYVHSDSQPQPYQHQSESHHYQHHFQPQSYQYQSHPSSYQYSNITRSPSLDNIVTGFTRLTPSSIPPSVASGVSSRRSSIQHQTQDQSPFQFQPPQPELQFQRSSQSPSPPKTYLILGASRGIGLEFARALLQANHQVIAVVRNPESAARLWQVTGQIANRPGSCIIEQCDISDPKSIDTFVSRMKTVVECGGNLDTIILNAGILEYDRGLGALAVSFEDLDRHLRVNCIGNIVLARKLVMLNDLESVRRRREQNLLAQASLQRTNQSATSPTAQNMADTSVQIPVRDAAQSSVQSSTNNTTNTQPSPTVSRPTDLPTIGRQIVFMSSDSGSMTDFREYEDGFAAYGASKVALNMMIRHMAVELRRMASKARTQQDWQSMQKDEIRPWQDEVCVLAMHPGEVSTDMANIEVGWDVEGVINAEESVRCMLGVLEQRTARDSGTFWRWDGTEHPW